MLLKKLLNNGFLRSGFFYSVVNFGASFLAYILNLIIARSFSLSDYGEYMSAVAYLTLFSIPLGALGMMVIKKIGSVDPDQRVGLARIIEKWLARELMALLPLISVISLFLGVIMFYKGQMSLPAITFVLLSSVLGIFSNFYGSVLQSYKEFAAVGAFSVASVVIKMILAIAIIWLFPTLWWLFGSFLLAGVFVTGVGHWIIGLPYKKNHQEKKSTTEVQLGKVFSYLSRQSVLIPLVTTLGIVGLANVDVVLVKKFFSGEEAGLYGSLSLLGRIVLYVAAPLSAVAYTYFTGKDSKHQSRKVLLVVTAIISAIGFGAALGYGLFPNLVVKIIFGDKFLGISQLVWLAAVFGALYSLMNLYAQYFVAKSSKFAYLGILAVAVQTLGIYITHNTLQQVLLVNITVNGTLVLIYMLEALRREFFYVRR